MLASFHFHSRSLASVKSRLVVPFWYQPTRVVSEKGPLNGCVCVCVSVMVTWTISLFDLIVADWSQKVTYAHGVCVCVQQKFTMDTAYYIVRELMNTERTYKKDLEVIALVCVVYVYGYMYNVVKNMDRKCLHLSLIHVFVVCLCVIC